MLFSRFAYDERGEGVFRHLAWNQIFADAEVLKRALGLGTPEPIGWDFDFA